MYALPAIDRTTLNTRSSLVLFRSMFVPDERCATTLRLSGVEGKSILFGVFRWLCFRCCSTYRQQRREPWTLMCCIFQTVGRQT